MSLDCALILVSLMLDLLHVLILVSLMLDLSVLVSLDVRSVCSDSCVFDLDLCVHVLILVSLDVRSVHTCSDSCVFGC